MADFGGRYRQVRLLGAGGMGEETYAKPCDFQSVD
jgi:hypothetical protein